MKNNQKKSLVVLGMLTGMLFFSSVSLSGQCLNLDFSMSNFTYWQPYIGSCNAMNININPSAVVPGRHTIMDAAQLILYNDVWDEQCQTIKKVPDGFNYSVKLGNSGTGAEMEALEYTMSIDSSNSLLILHFAWVMENPSHTPEEQPRFTMIIKDSLGNKIPNIPCGDVNFIASGNLADLACNTASLVARNWTTVGFNLETLIGQKIKIYFETRDCTQGGHFGYAYMVGECRPMAINVMHCDQDTAYLSAPDGFVQYRWIRSSQPTWVKEGPKELYRNIVIEDPVEGEEFICSFVSELRDECKATLHVIIPEKTLIDAKFLYGIMTNGGVDTTGHNSMSWYDTCARKATFVDLSSIENSTKASIIWEIPSLNVISTDSLFTYTFPTTDTIVEHLVRLTVSAKSGCVKTTERYITIYPSPIVDNVRNLVLCHGAKQIVNFTGTNMNTNISMWTNSDTAIGFGASGTGNISFTATNTGITPLTATITITPINDFPQCTGQMKTFTITVNPLPVIDNIENMIICAGENQIINFTGINIDVYNSTWTNSDTTIGLEANGTGNISFTATNTGTMPLLSIITMTSKSYNGCVGKSETFAIIVNPLPVMDSIEDIVLCAGEKQSINFTGINLDLDSSIWTNVNPAIGLDTMGIGNISFTAIDTGTSSLISAIMMTPKSSNGCVGEMKSIIIIVKPTPVMDSMKNIVLCAEESQIINFTGKNINLDSSTWTNSNTAIGLGANGNGNISFTATNTGTIPLISTITMTPKSNEGCVAAAEIFTVAVNSLPVMDTIEDIVVCAGEKQSIHFTGTNIDLDSSIWTNVNPDIGLGTNGVGNILFTATDTVTSSFISSVRMIPKSAAGCVGEVQTFTITISPLPVMDNVGNIVLCPGEHQIINFTGKNIIIDSSIWTNSNTAIGLGANGKGNISFTATNNTTIPFISTITVTPKSSDGCVAASKFFAITVNSLPVMDSIEDIVVCAGKEQSINFTGTDIDLDSSIWTNVNPDIGLGTNGVGNILFTATDTVTSSFISAIRMIPKSFAGCVGELQTFTITVSPLPTMDNVKDIVLCPGEHQVINFTSKNFYLDSSTWTNSNTAIGLAANGKGNISFTATNNTTIPFISTITVTPKSNEGCVAASKFFAITVNSLPVMDSIEDIVVCAGKEQSINFTGTDIDLDSSIWTNVNPDIGLGTNGVGNILFTATDTVTSSFISAIRMIPKSFAGCVGEVQTFTITVSPLPTMDNVKDIVLCPGEHQVINFTSKNFYLDSSTWTNSNTAIGLGANGKGNISFTATNNTTIPFISTITVTPKSNEGCVAASGIFTVTVNSLPVMDTIEDIVVCAGEKQSFNFTGTDIYLDSSIWTNVNPDIGLDKNGIGNISFTATNTVTSSLISSVRIIPKSAAGCVGKAKTFTIIVHPLPVMEDINDTILCVEERQIINFTGININLDSSTWTNSDTAIGLGASGKGNISFTSPDTGITAIATITMTPKSSEGCVGESKIFTITVNPDVRILAVVNDSLFCEGSNIEFEILNPNELTDIHWSGPNNFSSSIPNPRISDISLNNAGMYYVHATAYCNRKAISDSLFISVLPAITLDMEDTLVICDSEIVISPNLENATWYQWNTGKLTENITVSSAGKYWITASNQRCTAVDTTVVIQYVIPGFEIQTKGDLCQDGSVNLYVDIEDEDISYNWSIGDSSNNITVYETGLYRIAVSFMGCSSWQSIMVECPCEFWIPNMFTPNGDGLNDEFLPIPKTPLHTFSMSIHDRWGQLIFKTDTYAPWSAYGVNKEKYADMSVYLYEIRYSCLTKPDKELIINGKVSVLW